MNRYSLLLIPLIVIGFSSSYADSIEDAVTISISIEGTAKVTEHLSSKTTISSIKIPSVSDKISNILAIDENNIFLNTKQNGNLIRIDTLGASEVTLTYEAQIIKQRLGLWHITYNSNVPSTIILPSLSNIVSVNAIPIDIKDEAITMPPGVVEISYTISTITANNFLVSQGSFDQIIQIMTASNIEDFESSSQSISWKVDERAPILVITPKDLLSIPFEIHLNNNPIEFKQYYQNATHYWIRIDPSEAGSIKITEAGIFSPNQISEKPEQGGCLIATATFGSELSTEVQQLRELRDNVVLNTESGKSFMTSFNQFYYSFSPTIADWERQNPVFKEAVKLFITPLITSLSILNYVDMDSEAEVLGYGISLILLNVGMYVAAPVGIGLVLVRRK